MQNQEYEQLLDRPIWQMTGREFLSLFQGRAEETPKRTIADGADQLSAHLGCSASFIYSLIKTGVLNEAIVSHVGRKYSFDVEKARMLANEYQNRKRGC